MNKLEKTLFELLKGNPVHEISIKSLCDHAHIHRSTFYSYFSSVHAFIDYVEDKHIKSLYDHIQKQWISHNDIKIYYQQLLLHIYENKDIYYCFYVSDYSHFVEKTVNRLTECFTPFIDYPSLSPLDSKHVKLFNAYGCHGLIKTWIINDCNEPIDELALHLFKYTTRTLLVKNTYSK